MYVCLISRSCRCYLCECVGEVFVGLLVYFVSNRLTIPVAPKNWVT